MNTRSRRDVHAEITKLIKAIEANPCEPVMPWRKSGNPLWLPVNALTGNRYNGITQDVRADHAQHLALLQLLKDDPKAIFTAAARASEAVNYLNGLQHPGPRSGPAVTAAVDAPMPLSGALP
jgi:antirestriction protein ArdC